MPKRRITLSLDEDLVGRFQAAAELERRSLSAMVEGWLEQVVEPAEWVASLAQGERGKGLGNIHAAIAALQESQEQTIAALARAQGEGRRASGRRTPTLTPPSCNTGGKLPVKAERKRGGRA